jgi:hypothetical protein
MEGIDETGSIPAPARSFREEPEQDRDESVEVGLPGEAPLLVNMTDEPGGDPYNHTGRFRRMFR